MDSNQSFIDPATQARIIEVLSEKVRAYYVFPETAEKICAGLQKHLAEGDYSDLIEGDLFALGLTIHLQEFSRDEHLWVRWHAEPLPAEEQLRRDPGWEEEQQVKARLDNYGLHRAERLPGNVGYLDIRYFHRPEWGGETAAAAMNFLAGTDALIFDLRRCEGGYPDMIALISSYLFGPEPVHLNSIYWRDEDRTQEYWTLPNLACHRSTEKPVFVLTSKNTFSGGEEFAYNLKTRNRATLVGETTGGGAHPGASFRLDYHFEVFIPIGRSINPVTGTDWEGTGVIPDISVQQEQAFEAAYRLALGCLHSPLEEILPDSLLAVEIEEFLKKKAFI